jgi:hypothetical protein
MQRNNYVFKENNVFISQRYCKSRDDASQDVKELSCTVEFVSLMDQGEKDFVYGFSNHFTARHKLNRS